MKITLGLTSSGVTTRTVGTSANNVPPSLKFDEKCLCSAFIDYFYKSNLITENEASILKHKIDESKPKAHA